MNTAFLRAILLGNTGKARRLLDGSEVSQLPTSAALVLAAKAGSTEVAELLLNRGADVDWRTPEGRTALIVAAENRRVLTVRLLLKRGADPAAAMMNGCTGLIAAASKGCSETVLDLLNRGVSVNHQTQSGATALMYAAENGHRKIVLELLDGGADIDITTRDGRTALMFAAFSGFVTTVKTLLLRGADVSLRNADGLSALSCAAMRKDNFSIVRHLVLIGADLMPLRLITPYVLHLAASIVPTRQAIADFLDSGTAIDLNAINADGATALHMAVVHRNTEVVELLIERGAHIGLRDGNGSTPFDYADDELAIAYLRSAFKSACQNSGIRARVECANIIDFLRRPQPEENLSEDNVEENQPMNVNEAIPAPETQQHQDGEGRSFSLLEDISQTTQDLHNMDLPVEFLKRALKEESDHSRLLWQVVDCQESFYLHLLNANKAQKRHEQYLEQSLQKERERYNTTRRKLCRAEEDIKTLKLEIERLKTTSSKPVCPDKEEEFPMKRRCNNETPEAAKKRRH